MATPNQGLMECKVCGERGFVPHKNWKRLCEPCGKKRAVEAQRRYRRRQKALCRQVECVGCGRTFDTSQTNGKTWRCPRCLYEYHRQYRRDNLEKDASYARSYRSRQGDSYRDRMRQRYWDRLSEMTPAKVQAFRDAERIKARRLYSKVKREVFEAYGGYVCNCCGEAEPAFLSVDHIDENASEMRRKGIHGNSSTSLYQWLRKQGFPEGFQILCMNCQVGKHRNNGVCPHQARSND